MISRTFYYKQDQGFKVRAAPPYPNLSSVCPGLVYQQEKYCTYQVFQPPPLSFSFKSQTARPDVTFIQE